MDLISTINNYQSITISSVQSQKGGRIIENSISPLTYQKSDSLTEVTSLSKDISEQYEYALDNVIARTKILAKNLEK